MANCKIDLFASLAETPDTGGCWYFISVTGTLEDLPISDDNVTYYSTALAVNDLMENPPNVDAGDAMWVDFEGLLATQFKFAYVSPCPNEPTYNPNWVAEVCYDVSILTVNKVALPEDLEVTHCIEESGLNLFDDANVSNTEYTIEECVGGADCSLFNLGTGDYDPSAGIDVGAYVFRFEYINSCDNASFYLTVNISDSPDMGDVQTGIACDTPPA